MAPQTRRQSNASFASTSSYQPDEEDEDADGEPEIEVKEEPPVPVKELSRRGRSRNAVASYKESEDEMDLLNGDPDGVDVEDEDVEVQPRRTRKGAKQLVESDDEDDEPQPTRRRSTRQSTRQERNLADLVVNDDEDDEALDDGDYGARKLRSRDKKPAPAPASNGRRLTRGNSKASSSSALYAGPTKTNGSDRAARAAKRRAQEEQDVWKGNSSPSSAAIDSDGVGSDDLDLHIDDPPPQEEEAEDDLAQGRPYALRQRNTKINYAIPPPLDDLVHMNSKKSGGGGGGGRSGGRGGGGGRRPKLGWSMSGAELGRMLGEKGRAGDDSVGPFPSFWDCG